MSRLTMLVLLPLLALAACAALLRFGWAALTAPAKAWAIARAFDRLANAATNGRESETVSSRAALARDQGKRWGCVLCGLLDRIEQDHCNRARGV